ncbi:MAG: hypothetical protein ACRDT0_15025 [Pseudonocardiaceae bacterium]
MSTTTPPGTHLPCTHRTHLECTRDTAALHTAAYDLVDQAVRRACQAHGSVPGVGTCGWWAAPADVRLAALLIAAVAWIVNDPDRALAERLRQMSLDLSGAADWSRPGPSHAELQRRRATAPPTVTVRCAQPGCARTFTTRADPTQPGRSALRCWDHDDATGPTATNPREVA